MSTRIPAGGSKAACGISFDLMTQEGSIPRRKGQAMKKRIVVLKKAVNKEDVAEGLCCIGGFIPYLWA